MNLYKKEVDDKYLKDRNKLEEEFKIREEELQEKIKEMTQTNEKNKLEQERKNQEMILKKK